MLPPDVEDALRLVQGYAPELKAWIEIKKQLVKNLSPKSRSLFSRRHPITKFQQTNEFELRVASRWEELTGNSVLFSRQHEQA